ncbi:MAG TPA: hypothetical protein VFJ93_07580 [Gaiellaceae bacterium]|nr:hypothetical protein [Gaiellaceae bacterium]
MRKAFRAAGLLAVTAALVAGVATAADGPSATITSPTAGQKISARHNAYVALAGTASFATPAAETTRFYLRRDGCGTTSDNPHLSVTSGTDGGDGCGLVLTIVGVGGTADQGAFVDYPSTDGMPLTLDASQPVTGTIDLQSFGITDPLAAGTGLVTVSVSLEALYQGNGVSVGSDSENVLITPTQTEYPVAFTIQPNGALDRAGLSGLDLRVHVEGPYAFSGFIGNSGKSFTDVPSWSASFDRSVDVSVDDPTFANAVPARLSGTTWSVAVPTPTVGSHTVYARATQGFDTGAAASRSFTVTK